MATINADVMKMIEDTIKKNPKVSNPELFEKAKEIDPSIAELTSRQFNARYPLQVRRRLAPSRPRRREEPKQARPRRARRRTEAEATPDRAAIRGILLQFAKNIAAAENKADVVEAIGDIDRYIDRILKAAEPR